MEALELRSILAVRLLGAGKVGMPPFAFHGLLVPPVPPSLRLCGAFGANWGCGVGAPVAMPKGLEAGCLGSRGLLAVSSTLPLRPGGGASFGTELLDIAGELNLRISDLLLPDGDAKLSLRPGGGASFGTDWSDFLPPPNGKTGFRDVSLLTFVSGVILGGG